MDNRYVAEVFWIQEEDIISLDVCTGKNLSEYRDLKEAHTHLNAYELLDFIRERYSHGKEIRIQTRKWFVDYEVCETRHMVFSILKDGRNGYPDTIPLVVFQVKLKVKAEIPQRIAALLSMG